jgi:uncharacterized protein (DUF1778 family)
LKRAAEIRGRTLTDFVIAAADEAACRAIQETEIIRLSIDGQRQIAAAILNPPAATSALKKAARRYREMFGVECPPPLFVSRCSRTGMIELPSVAATKRLTGIFRRR